MVDDAQAGAQTGAGPLFRAFSDGTREWAAAIVSFVTGGSPNAWSLQAVQDADGQRLPTKPIGPRGVLTNHSGTITTGGASQQLIAANPSRNYLTVFNPQTESESLFINFTSAAAPNNTSYELPPGAMFSMIGPGFVSTEAITIVAATSAHPFGCKEG